MRIYGMGQPSSSVGTYDGILSCLGPMLRAARGMTGSLADAEDLVQDVVSSVLPKWDTVTSDPLPYLLRAISNRAVSRHRKGVSAIAATSRLRALHPANTGSPPEAAVLDHEIVFAALQALDPQRRAAVVLRYGLDLDVKSTAAILGHPEGTVRRWCHEALAQLRVDPTLKEPS